MAKETKTITIKDILKGCEPGRIQTVGYMQVIPLVSDLHDDRFVAPSGAKVGTSSYGTLVIRNTADQTMILPAQIGYVVNQQAQDHALPHVGLVKGKDMRAFDTAACIQQSQGGYIAEGEHQMLVLPLPLRETAHTMRKERNYSRLWPAISNLNAQAGISKTYGSGGHLEYFLKEFKNELETFVAQFEPVENQIGAIIIINGKLMGIERAPNPEYWLDIWPALIRECYGSMAILEAKKHGPTPPVPKTRVSLGKVKSLDELKQKLVGVTEEEYNRVKTIVANLLGLELASEVDEAFGGKMNVEAVSNKRFVGQIVTDDSKVVYASLVSCAKTPTAEDFYMQEEFKM